MNYNKVIEYLELDLGTMDQLGEEYVQNMNAICVLQLLDSDRKLSIPMPCRDGLGMSVEVETRILNEVMTSNLG